VKNEEAERLVSSGAWRYTTKAHWKRDVRDSAKAEKKRRNR
jgi:hypothetical protein